MDLPITAQVLFSIPGLFSLFRKLAEIQETTDTVITPYEKNLGRKILVKL